MESIIRQIQRFREHFAQAIYRETTGAEYVSININNPNTNRQRGPGAITNNNQNFINVFYAGTSNANARLVRAT